MDDVTDVINEYDPHVLCISETWLDPSIKSDLVNIGNYSFERFDNTDNSFIGKQGVGIYIKNTHTYNIRYDLSVNDLMSITIEIFKVPNIGNLFVTSVYRHPNANIDYINKIEELFMKLDSLNVKSVVTGDFNCDYNKVNDTSSLAANLESRAVLYNYTQLIQVPTRVTKSSSTIIDLTFINFNDVQVTQGVAIVSVADHFMNYLIFPSKTKKPNHKFIYVRNYKKLYNNDDFVNELNNLPWQLTVELDLENGFKLWNIMFLSVVDKFSPVKKMRTRKNRCPWFSCKIENFKKIRNYAHVNAVKTGDWELYKFLKNKVSCETKKVKQEYIKKGISENFGNTGSTWTFLKKLLPKSSMSMMYNIFDENGILQ